MKRSWSLAWVARFVAPWEGFSSTIYADSGGILTQGYGHTGSGLTAKPWSKAKGLRVLAEDIRFFAQGVDRLVRVKLSRRQRIATISFAFNTGLGNLEDSTFLRRLNQGKYAQAADQLLRWTKDERGNDLLGLERRRRAERWMFLHNRKHSKRVTRSKTPKTGRG